jgi:leader peptidase (prepilin peptidase)/N-methyltransferase
MPEAALVLIALAAGLLAGSFLNVCIYRWPRDLSVISPRSHCPNCAHPVAWHDNIPLLSYALLKGRCRHCHERIPLRYPIVEALTAVLFVAIVLQRGASLSAVGLCVFVALSVGLLFSDLEQRDLPDQFTLGGVVLGLVFAWLVPFPSMLSSLILPHWNHRWLSLVESAFGAALPAFLLWGLGAAYEKVRHKEGVGLGDVKMVAMIGAFLGLMGAVTAVMVGSLLGSVLGLAYIYGTHKDPTTYELPFGTFLSVGAIAVALLSLR